MARQPNWSRPLYLAVALVVLGTFAYWLEYSHKPKKEAEEELKKKLFSVKETPVAKVRIVDGPKVFVVKCLDLDAKLCKAGDTSKWELEEPAKMRADDANVNSLLSSLNNLTSTDTIDLTEETPDKRLALLREYKLNDKLRDSRSVRKIEVVPPSGDSTVAFFGDTHPVGDSIFVATGKGKEGAEKVDENHVYLVPAYTKSHFERNLTYWRDKKLFTVASHEVESFRLEEAGGKGSKGTTIEGERKDGQWELKVREAPKGKRGKATEEEYAGDSEAIDSLLTGATYLMAKEIPIDEKSSAHGRAFLKGAKKTLSLTVEKARLSEKEPAPAPVTVTFFEKGKGKLFATVSNLDPVYELEPNAKDRIAKQPKDLRLARLLTSMERFSARRLAVEGGPVGSPPVVLTQKDGKWSLDPPGGEVSQDKVLELLDKLSGSKIRDFLTGKAIPKGAESGTTITIGDDKTEKKRSYVFWKAGDKLYAKDLLSSRPEAFLMDTGLQAALPSSRDFFVKQPAPTASPQPTAAKGK